MTDDSSNPKVDAALAYSARGWRVIQLHGIAPDGKCTCRDRDKPGHERIAGKHPVNPGWQNSEPMTEAQIREAWGGWRANHNVGVATGTPSGFFVLDIDPDNGGAESAKRLAEEYPALFDPTICVVTGSGGWHYYFAMPEDFDVTNARGRLKDYPGIDIRGTGGQVVVPPSTSAKGAYFLAGTSAAEVGPAPAWLLDMLRPVEKFDKLDASDIAPHVDAMNKTIDDVVAQDPRLGAYAERAWNGEVARLQAMRDAAAPGGEGYQGEPWNATTFEVACNLLELANAQWTPYSRADVLQAMVDFAPTDEGFTPEDVDARIESALKKVGDTARPLPMLREDRSLVAGMMADLAGPGASGGEGSTPPQAPGRDQYTMRTWDDLGNGMRFVDHFGKNLRYIAESESWTHYRDGRWHEMKGNRIQGLAQSLFESGGVLQNTEAFSYSNEAEEGEESLRAKFLTFVAKQRMAARVASCVSMAAGRTQVQASINDFDAQHHLLNVKNGVVDLRTGELLPHNPSLLLMKRADVEYDPKASCHRWQGFLDRVMPDVEQQRYLQRVVGYSLTGETIAQAFFIHHGSGANGKSVFLQVVRAVVGDYGQTIPRETLLAKKDGEHPTSIARMKGMRFLEVSETAPGRRLDEEVVKNLTGGEKTTARFMGKDFFDFTPTGKIHYVTNHLPILSDANSIWRRLHLIRWGVTIPEAEQNLRLAEELIEHELSGVLAWAVRGAMFWHEQGLMPPESMLDELATYREDSDAFGEFLRETTVRGEHLVTLLKQLHERYLTWCFSANIKKPMTRQSFSATLKERGFEQTRLAAGVAFRGLGLVEQKVDTSWANL